MPFFAVLAVILLWCVIISLGFLCGYFLSFLGLALLTVAFVVFAKTAPRLFGHSGEYWVLISFCVLCVACIVAIALFIYSLANTYSIAEFLKYQYLHPDPDFFRRWFLR